MNDLSAVKITQSIENAFSNLAQHFLSCSSAKLPDFTVDAVQTSSLAEFHGNGNRARGFIHKCTVVPTNMLRCAVFVEV